MSPKFDHVTAHALALPADERVEQLAQRLWASVEGEFDEELFAEIERREAEIRAGSAKPLPYQQAMQEIRDSLKQ